MSTETQAMSREGLIDEKHLEYLSRRLEEIEQQIELLKEDSPGSAELYRYIQMGIDVRRMIEEARALWREQDKAFADMLFDLFKGIVDTLRSDNAKANPGEIVNLVKEVFIAKTKSYQRKDTALRRQVYGLREKNLEATNTE